MENSMFDYCLGLSGCQYVINFEGYNNAESQPWWDGKKIESLRNPEYKSFSS